GDGAVAGQEASGAPQRASDWGLLAAVAPVLGLRTTVVLPNGGVWTAGPESGSTNTKNTENTEIIEITLLRLESGDAGDAAWAAAVPMREVIATASAPVPREAELTAEPVGTPGQATVSAPAFHAPTDTTQAPTTVEAPQAQPETFFGAEPRAVFVEPVTEEELSRARAARDGDGSGPASDLGSASAPGKRPVEEFSEDEDLGPDLEAEARESENAQGRVTRMPRHSTSHRHSHSSGGRAEASRTGDDWSVTEAVLSDDTLFDGLLLGDDGALHRGPVGRNLTDVRVSDLRTDKIRLLRQRHGERPHLGKEQDAPWGRHAYFMVVDGDEDGAYIGGKRVTWSKVGKVLKKDRLLKAMGPDTPVVLVTDDLSAQGTAAQRAVGNELRGNQVFTVTGKSAFARKDGMTYLANVDDDPEAPYGGWVYYSWTGTELTLPERVWTPVSGRTFRTSDLVLRPVPHPQGKIHGTLFPWAGDPVRTWESEMTQRSALSLHHEIPRGGFTKGAWAGYRGETLTQPAAPVESPDLSRTVFMAGHATPGGFLVGLRNGGQELLPADQGGQLLADVARASGVPKNFSIHLDACWGVVPWPEPLLAVPKLHAPTPRAHDELRLPSLAQEGSTRSGHMFSGYDRPTGSDLAEKDGRPAERQLLLTSDARGNLGRRVDSRPYPKERQLTSFADRARLTGRHRLETAQVLWLALRKVFGLHAEDDPKLWWDRLVPGIGALENLRVRDPQLGGFTDFQLDLWTTLARKYGDPHGAGSRTHYLAVLDAAHRRVRSDGGTGLVDHANDPALRGAVERFLPTTSGGTSAFDERGVRTVLLLPADEPVTTADVGRAMWANVAARRAVRTWQSTGTAKRIATKVLHLPQDESFWGDYWSQHWEHHLTETVTKAQALGWDISDPTELAVMHLRELGAYAPESALPTTGPGVGRNLSGVALRPVDLTRAQSITANGPVTADAPWSEFGLGNPYVLYAPNAPQDGTIEITLPGNTGQSVTLSVPLDELMVLADRDPLRERTDLNDPAIFVVPGLAHYKEEVLRPF
uniref:lonely Cys domain-containing protein n=2 Tax=Streptomyces TaxID=1883 RepID=UPI000B13F249